MPLGKSIFWLSTHKYPELKLASKNRTFFIVLSSPLAFIIFRHLWLPKKMCSANPRTAGLFNLPVSCKILEIWLSLHITRLEPDLWSLEEGDKRISWDTLHTSDSFYIRSVILGVYSSDPEELCPLLPSQWKITNKRKIVVTRTELSV